MKWPCGEFLSGFHDFGDARRMSVSLPFTGSAAIAHSGDSYRVSLQPPPGGAAHNEPGPLIM
jgi:hypothetical protein